MTQAELKQRLAWLKARKAETGSTRYDRLIRDTTRRVVAGTEK